MPSITATPPSTYAAPQAPAYRFPEPLDPARFQELVANSRGPVAVEFFSYGCPHCRRMEPLIRAVGEKLNGKIPVYQIEINEQPDLAARFGISGVPAVLMFKDGRRVAQLLGEAPNAATLERDIKARLGVQ